MHWADTSSLELARFAAALAAMGVPAMLVITYRTVDGGDTELHGRRARLARTAAALLRIALVG